jgi:hypothetical protein
MKTEHFVDFVSKVATGIRRGNGNGDDNRTGPFLTYGADRRAHGRTGRQSIVHEDHDAIAQVGHRARTAVFPKAPLELAPLALGDRTDDMWRNVVRAHDIAVEDLGPGSGNRAHRQLGVPWDAKLADQENIERRLQFARDFVRNRHPTTWERQHDDVSAVLILCETPGEKLPSLAAIVKSLHSVHLNVVFNQKGATPVPSERLEAVEEIPRLSVLD